MTEDATEIFLRQFLSDPFVLPIPFPFRNFLAQRIAKKRKAIYLSALKETAINGQSSICVYTERLAEKVEKYTGRKTYAAYRYGKNNLSETIEKAKHNGADTITIIPTYPQNAKPTTQSMKAVIDKIKKKSNLNIIFKESYCDHPLYIDAIANSIRATKEEKNEKPENLNTLIFSFHSVPVSMTKPYFEECEKTARLVCEKLSAKNALIGWQSKTGKGKWLEPSTESLIKKVARRGIKNATLVCAGFATDCTETLIEIDKDLKEVFFKNGGEKFNYVPCLNDSDTQAKLYATLFEEMI